MSRRLVAAGTLAGICLFGGASRQPSMTLTPALLDFGRLPVNQSGEKSFVLSGTKAMSTRGVPKVEVKGRDAADFTVDSSRRGIGGGSVSSPAPGGSPANPSPLTWQSSCFGTAWALNGSCDYRVIFHPSSVGRKTAQLVIEEDRVTTAATLTGEGIFSCRPHLVSCNYADNYSGEYTVRTVDSTLTGRQDRKGRWATTIDVKIVRGVATCSGVQNDWEEEYNGTTLNKRSTVVGTINGPGLFAVEFQGSGTSMEYKISFACPSATLKTTDIDYLAGTSGTGKMESEPADWRRGGLAADPQPATKLGVDLIGKQTDLHSDPGNVNDLVGYSTMTWSIKRW
jgi:hypothetical protein